jgi:hypothetical protein
MSFSDPNLIESFSYIELTKLLSFLELIYKLSNK